MYTNILTIQNLLKVRANFVHFTIKEILPYFNFQAKAIQTTNSDHVLKGLSGKCLCKDYFSGRV